MKRKVSKNSRKAGRTIESPPARPKIREILTSTDFSEESHGGVCYAVALAKKLNAAVTLLHVIEPPPRMAGMEDVALTREDSEMTALARVQLQRLAKRESEGSLQLTSCVRTGKPFHAITTVACERAADLIVLATHGYTGVKRALLGSTAERVVRHGPCPVLTVPTRTTPKRIGRTRPFKLKRILVPCRGASKAGQVL